MVRLAREREELRVVADQVGAPTYTGDLAAAIFNLLALEGEGGALPYGLYHFADQGSCSWHGFAEAIVAQARACGEELKVRQVTPIDTADYPLPAPRPAYSVFDTGRYRRATGKAIPPLAGEPRTLFSLRSEEELTWQASRRGSSSPAAPAAGSTR